MHLGNGAITPECAAVTYGAAAAGLAASAAALRAARPNVEKLWLAVGLGCAVFAAQAINVPVAPGMSGHLVGGVLLAWALGPALGAWTMAAVLAAQALLLGDGGMAALGANVINMALAPAGMVALLTRLDVYNAAAFQRAFLGPAAMIAIFLATLLIVAETALFRPANELTVWSSFASLMMINHCAIGVVEGFATTLIIALYRVAPSGWPIFRGAWIGLTVAALVTAFAIQFGSSLPDGYEAAAQASCAEWLLER